MVIFLEESIFRGITTGSTVIELDSEIMHYLIHVLRIGKGEKIIINSKENRVNRYEFFISYFDRALDKFRVRLNIEEKKYIQKNFPIIDIFVVPLKSRYFEDSIEYISQLPINSIFLMRSKFIAVKFEEVYRKIERLRKIIYWNSIYVRKHFITEIQYIDKKLENIVEELLKEYEKVIVFDPRAESEFGNSLGNPQKIAMLVGPEGGWSKEELEIFKHKFQIYKFKNIDIAVKAEIAPVIGVSQLLGFIN